MSETKQEISNQETNPIESSTTGESQESQTQTTKTPTGSNTFTRTQDGWQSTVTVSFEVTTTFDTPGPSGGAPKAPNEQDTESGGGPKGGLGVIRKTAPNSSEQGGTASRAVLGVERKE